MHQLHEATDVESLSSFVTMQGMFPVCSVTRQCGPFYRGMALPHEPKHKGSDEFGARFAPMRRSHKTEAGGVGTNRRARTVTKFSGHQGNIEGGRELFYAEWRQLYLRRATPRCPRGHPALTVPPVAPAVAGRLVGSPAVIFAIRQAVEILVSAEVKSLDRWVTDRPFAHLVVKRHQRDIETNRNNHLLRRYRRRQASWRGMGVCLERSIAGDKATTSWTMRRRRSGFSRPWAARGRFGAPREPEPVYLADHGIARYATKLIGDLAGTQPIGPKLFEQRDAFVGPRHPHLPVQGSETQNPPPHVVLTLGRRQTLNNGYKGSPRDMSYLTRATIQ